MEKLRGLGCLMGFGHPMSQFLGPTNKARPLQILGQKKRIL